MRIDNEDGRLTKTIRLLDSPIAGERAAALEAACRQLETLGLSWADVAPKFAALVGSRDIGAAQFARNRTDRLLFNTCRWGECSQTPVDRSPFCKSHLAKIIGEPLDDLVPFLKNLPPAIGADITGEALYHAVHAAVHCGMFNRYLGHDLLRAAGASRDGNGIEGTIDKLAAAVGPSEKGEFMMHLKRQLIVPERRSVRREATDRSNRAS